MAARGEFPCAGHEPSSRLAARRGVRAERDRRRTVRRAGPPGLDRRAARIRVSAFVLLAPHGKSAYNGTDQFLHNDRLVMYSLDGHRVPGRRLQTSHSSEQDYRHRGQADLLEALGQKLPAIPDGLERVEQDQPRPLALPKGFQRTMPAVAGVTAGSAAEPAGFVNHRVLRRPTDLRHRHGGGQTGHTCRPARAAAWRGR